MKKILTGTLLTVAMIAGTAVAGEPVPLTSHQLDNVTGGLSVVLVNQAGFSFGSAGTSGSSLVLGLSIGGADAAFGAGSTAGASAGAGVWGTTNGIAAW